MLPTMKFDQHVVKCSQNLDFSISEQHSSIRLNLTMSGSFHEPQNVDLNVFYGRFTSKNTFFSLKKLRKISPKTKLSIGAGKYNSNLTSNDSMGRQESEEVQIAICSRKLLYFWLLAYVGTLGVLKNLETSKNSHEKVIFLAIF